MGMFVLSVRGHAFDPTPASLLVTCSEMARHYDTWRKWVKKHGPNIPYTPTNKKSVKADVVELMLADDDLSDDVKARVLANAVFSSSKSYAG